MKITELLMEETLPKKSLFNGSEVSNLLKVKPHEIRYWESEFPQIKPQKTKHGQRLYRKDDVILFSAIKHLLHDKKFTVAGALKVLADSELMQSRISAPIAPLSEALASAEEVAVEERATFEEIAAVEEIANPEELATAPECDQDLLQDSFPLLPEPDLAFDEQTHEIYQHCAEHLEEASVEVEAKHVGEMIADALSHQAQQEAIPRLSKLEYEKAFAILIASKIELSDLLLSLEKYGPNDFWGEFKGD